MMTGAELWQWAQLDSARRRTNSSKGGWLTPWIVTILGTILLSAETARRTLESLHIASKTHLIHNIEPLWMTSLVVASIILVFGYPYMLYWRWDSGLLARLSISGKAHLYVALRRGVARMLMFALPLVLSAIVFALLTGHWASGLKQILVIGVVLFSSLLLGASAAVLAGSIVASDKVQAAIASFGGEFQAPKTSWLGILPGLTATFCAAVALGASPWPLSKSVAFGHIGILLGPFFALAIVGLAWSWRTSDAVLSDAIREVAALDREILAHVERSTPSKLEMWFASFGGWSEKMKHLFVKDATLMRRRFPMPYFVFPCAVLVIWIFLLAKPEGGELWGTAIFVGLGMYSTVLAKRVWQAPVEHMRYLKTLPLTMTEIRRVKRRANAIRVLIVLLLAGIPWLVFSHNQPMSFWGIAILGMCWAVGSMDKRYAS